MPSSLRRLLAAIALAAACSGSAESQTISAWATGVSGAFHNDASWSVGGSVGQAGATPDSVTESAHFTVAADYTVGLTPGSNTLLNSIEARNDTMVTLAFDPLAGGTGDASLTASGSTTAIGTNTLLRVDTGNANQGSTVTLSSSSVSIQDGAEVAVRGNALLDAGATLIDRGSAGLGGRSTLDIAAAGLHTLGAVSIGESGAGDREGVLSIANSAIVEATSLSVASNGLDPRGEVSIFDATLRQTGAAGVAIGANASTGTATVLIGSDGVLDTGAGGVTVRTTGSLLNNGGSLQVAGDFEVVGGLYRELGAAERQLGATSDIRLTAGGRIELGAEILSLANTQDLFIAGTGSELTSNGGFSLGENATLEIEYPSAATSTAPLRFDGSAELLGELAVSFAAGSTPTLGLTLPVLEASSFVSESLSLTAPTLAAGLAWDLQINGDELQLIVVSDGEAPGDYNDDGSVSGADYTLVRDTLGGGAPIGSFAEWKTNFGVSPQTLLAAPQEVPEPGTLAMIAVGSTASVMRRRRNKLAGMHVCG